MADVRRLPIPVTEIWEWQMRALCRGMSSDVFFPPDRERGAARADREARAKMVCRACPVLEQCRDHALAVREPYGVWGGLSAADRHQQVRAEVDEPVVIDVDFTREHHRRHGVPTRGPFPA